MPTMFQAMLILKVGDNIMTLVVIALTLMQLEWVTGSRSDHL